MLTTQLRLKNWLQLGERYCYVSSLFISHFRAVDKDGIDLGNSLQVNYQPVRLTPEILEKAGFVYENDYQHKKFDGVTLSWDGHTIMVYDPNFERGSGIIVQCKFFHQLQNLIFALTGTELEINL